MQISENGIKVYFNRQKLITINYLTINVINLKLVFINTIQFFQLFLYIFCFDNFWSIFFFYNFT